MKPEVLSLFGFLTLLLLLIMITESLHRYFKLPVEQSRKFLHVSGGLMCLALPFFFSSHWWILVLTGTSFLLLLVTYLKKSLNSIHQTNRHSVGSVIFPIPVYLCFLFAELMKNDLYFFLPISLLTIADTAAETAGKKWGYHAKQFFGGQKTLIGTFGFFVAALPVCLTWALLCHLPANDTIMICLLIPAITAITELATLHGWDNLTVPIVADVILWLLI